MKQDFANTIVSIDLGNTASSVTDDCFKYGITYGCDTDCPTLINGDCELKDGDNKELYLRVLNENGE